MIHQDGAAQQATAQNSGSLTIPGIAVAEPDSDCLLIVVVAAKGPGMRDPRAASVHYGGRDLTRAVEGSGMIDSQFGGIWIYTLSNPAPGFDVVITFQDLVADHLAGIACVFRGVDQNEPIGAKEGVLGSSPNAVLVSPVSSQSQIFTAMISGIGEESRFSESEIVAAMESGDMAINVAISESPGREFEINFSDGNSRNAIAFIELLPAAEQQAVDVLRVTKICFNGNSLPVEEGTTSDDGTQIEGDYGILTIGADGSYDYLAEPSAAKRLPKTEILNEIFIYVLSDDSENPLEVPVNEGDEEFGVDMTPVSDDPGDLVVTGIRFDGAEPLAVANGTTGDDGTPIEGEYGTLTIGSDGSYSYLADTEIAQTISPHDQVFDIFAYLLSDGSESPLEVEVEGVIPEVAVGELEEYEDSIFAITEVTSGSGQILAVAAGSTAESGGTNITGAYGVLTIGADGSYEYEVDPDLTGPLPDSPKDVFAYTISDGITAEFSELTISVSVPDVVEPEPEGIVEDVVAVEDIAEQEFEVGEMESPIAVEEMEVPLVAEEEFAVPPAAEEMESPIAVAEVEVPFVAEEVETPAVESAEIPIVESHDELESISYQVSFEADVEHVEVGDFEVVGAPGALITNITRTSPGVYDIIIEGLNLSKFSDEIGLVFSREDDEPEGEITVESQAVEPKFAVNEPILPEPEPPKPRPSRWEMGFEAQLPRFSSSTTMMSGATMNSYSDFGSTQFTSEIDVTHSGTPVFEIATPAYKLITLTDLEVPNILASHLRERPAAGKSPVPSMPLEGITRLFRDPEDKRFFGGIRVSEEDPGAGGISYYPYFAGSASNGAAVKITIMDAVGNEVITLSEFADPSGYWTVSPKMVLERTQYTITVEETPATWDGATLPSRSMASHFTGGFPGNPDKIPLLMPGQIIGQIINGRSMEEMVNGMLNQESFVSP